jgi:hypothetical protein
METTVVTIEYTELILDSTALILWIVNLFSTWIQRRLKN